MQLRVSATALNLRSESHISATNVLAVLPHGQVVTAQDAALGSWRQVTAVLGGSAISGFVHRSYLTADPPQMVESSRVAAVHLREDRREVTPRVFFGRAFPIGDPDRPRGTDEHPADRRQLLGLIIEYLDVERSARYAPQHATTYCNIYAYDYCYLAGAYIPRVWWKDRALERLGRGEPVEPRYDSTLRELRANDLYDWFTDYGEEFGWRRCFDTDDLQDRVNGGAVGVVVAQRSRPGRPGHVSVVVPETPDHVAARVNGRVVRPLQSQAGRVNTQYSPGRQRWWQRSAFRAFGFWVTET